MKHCSIQLWQQMNTVKLTRISDATAKQYQKAINRFCADYSGPLTNDAIQSYIVRVGVCLYTRILRTIFNNYFSPLLCKFKLHVIKRKPPTVLSYLSFIPHYIRQSKKFSCFEEKLKSYINCSQPELRKQTNIRYQISLLWQLLLQQPNLESATEHDILIAVRNVCIQKRGGKQAIQTKATHVVRTLNKFCNIYGNIVPASKYIQHFVKNSIHTDNQIIQNNSHTNAVKRRYPINNTLTRVHIDRMKSCVKSIRDEAIFMLMLETGLRRRAVCWMALQGVTDGTNIRSTGYAIEKGLKIRYFSMSNTLQNVLKTYIATDVPNNSHWLFPQKGDVSQHISSSTIRNIFVRICNKSCIPAHLSHCHAIRKFVVCELMRAGNSIEQVSKWLGHESVNTTYNHYWDVSVNELSTQMNIPWLVS